VDGIELNGSIKRNGTVSRMEGWKDGRMDGWMDGWMKEGRANGFLVVKGGE